MAPKCAVLLVEDDDDLCEILCRRLTRSGMDVTTASDARSAVDAASQTRFHVAVVDRALGRSCGWVLMETLKQLDGELPVIAMSGSCDDESLAAARQLGACEFLVKPFALRDLEAAIERAMRTIAV